MFVFDQSFGHRFYGGRVDRNCDGVRTRGCAWNAGSNVDWITITSGSSGSGAERLTTRSNRTWDPPRNAPEPRRLPGRHSPSPRGPKAATTVSLSAGRRPANRSFPSRGGTGTLLVTADGCSWMVTTPDSWLTFTSASTGKGSGEVAFTVDVNDGMARTGRFNLGDQSVEIQQGAAISKLIKEKQIDISSWCVVPKDRPIWTVAFEDGTGLDAYCSSRVLEGEFVPSYKLYFINTAGIAFRIAQCAFSGGINEARYRYVDKDQDFAPDRLIDVDWLNIDGGKDDKQRSVEGFVFTTDEEPYLDVLTFHYDAPTNKLSWKNEKYLYPIKNRGDEYQAGGHHSAGAGTRNVGRPARRARNRSVVRRP